MDPVTPTAAVRCPVDGCEYHPNVADAALAATLLSIHAQSLHVATPAPAPSYTAGATARLEKISRPTVDEGVSLEDWLYFEQRWREYNNATRITGLDLTYQLLDCCNPSTHGFCPHLPSATACGCRNWWARIPRSGTIPAS